MALEETIKKSDDNQKELHVWLSNNYSHLEMCTWTSLEETLDACTWKD